LAQTTDSGAIARFGEFEVDLRQASVRLSGTPVAIQEKPLQLLLALLEKPGQLVSRDELCSRLWPGDSFGAFEDGLNTAVRKLRLALGDSVEASQFIETVPKRGYRFIAPIKFVSEADSPAVDLPATGNSASATRKRHRTIAIALSTGLVVATAVFLMTYASRHRRSDAEFTSIAVLPLDQLSGDPSQEYFADGMTDALITDLAQITSLRVISRSSAMHFKGTHLTVRQIADQLGVDAVVEGSVTRSGDHVRITAQLIDARQDRHLWAESYNGEMSDILTLQNTVAQSIAREVNAKLAPARKDKPSRPIRPAAYEAYLKGWHFWNKYTGEDWQKAIHYFQESIDADPQFAPAYVGLSDSYSMLNAYSLMPATEAMPKAKAAAEKALELDNALGEAHIALANAQFAYDWDWNGAEREFQKGLQLSPNYALGYHWHSFLLQVLGHQKEGIAEQERAASLDPLSLIVNTNLCRAYLFAKQLDTAIRQCRKTLELDPNFWVASRWLTEALYQKGAYREYLEESERALRASGDSELAVEYHRAFSAGGIEGLMRWKAQQYLKDAQTEFRPDTKQAAAYIALGDKENALRYLERGYEHHEFAMLFLALWEDYAPLRSDPRYISIRRKMNLPY
jgi:TolB-like protein/DNA-binding winged helix-turn-helix (wHTH) protein/Tfp pilus assembly protein PilF